MTKRSAHEIPFDELPENVKRELRKTGNVPSSLGAGSPLLPARTFDEKKAQHSRAASKRVRSGKTLERELELVHYSYELSRRAKISKFDPPTVWKKGPKGWELRQKPGGGPCDFFGTVAYRRGRACVFDAKKLKEGTAAYTYPEEQRHQLKTLREHHDVGALAFLLLADQDVGVAYLVADPEAWATLAAGKSIELRRIRQGVTRAQFGTPERFEHLWPTIERPRDLLTMQLTPTWDWLSHFEREASSQFRDEVLR
jgi:penicillin-binding protein-related factor A (putative recombinase)